jgi:PPM family protein phosphatase
MIQFCGRTDVGRRRHRNEDSILVSEGILAVCDGMGGHQAGDVASRIAVDAIGTFIGRSGADPDLTWPYGFDPSLSFDANRIRTAIKLANRAIFTRATAEDEYAGMGTTVVATLVAPGDARFTYGHVGDSRIYIIRGGRAVQLTRDDSLANSAWADAEEAGAMKNVLTKALGVRGEVEFDVAAHDLQPDDTVLLCSDGLTNMLDDDAIIEIVGRYDGHLDKTCDQLVDGANARGGRDNISAILFRFE